MTVGIVFLLIGTPSLEALSNFLFLDYFWLPLYRSGFYTGMFLGGGGGKGAFVLSTRHHSKGI